MKFNLFNIRQMYSINFESLRYALFIFCLKKWYFAPIVIYCQLKVVLLCLVGSTYLPIDQ